MNFIFEWSTWYLTSERSEISSWTREDKIHIHKGVCNILYIRTIKITTTSVIFCLLYNHQWNTKSACFQRRDLLCNHNDGDLFTCEDNLLWLLQTVGILPKNCEKLKTRECSTNCIWIESCWKRSLIRYSQDFFSTFLCEYEPWNVTFQSTIDYYTKKDANESSPGILSQERHRHTNS